MNSLTETPPIFTRYLYIKNDVIISLLYSCLKKDIDQSLFWGYELYYSSFKQELIEILISIYNEFYKKVNSIKIANFIEKKIQEWKSDYKNDAIIATIIANIVCRDSIFANDLGFDLGSTVRGNDGGEAGLFCSPKKTEKKVNKKKKIIFIIYDKKDIIPYETILVSNDIKHYRILLHACKYSSIKNTYNILDNHETGIISSFIEKYKINIPRQTLINYFRNNWEFYASFTPIWKDRIVLYGGKINYEKKQIIFEDDELEDIFYGNFGYEPDEQSLDILEKTVAIN